MSRRRWTPHAVTPRASLFWMEGVSAVRPPAWLPIDDAFAKRKLVCSLTAECPRASAPRWRDRLSRANAI